MGNLVQCEVPWFYRVYRKLNVHVHHDRETDYLLESDLDVVKVVLDVRSLEKLEMLIVFNFGLFLCFLDV